MKGTMAVLITEVSIGNIILLEDICPFPVYFCDRPFFPR